MRDNKPVKLKGNIFFGNDENILANLYYAHDLPIFVNANFRIMTYFNNFICKTHILRKRPKSNTRLRRCIILLSIHQLRVWRKYRFWLGLLCTGSGDSTVAALFQWRLCVVCIDAVDVLCHFLKMMTKFYEVTGATITQTLTNKWTFSYPFIVLEQEP